MLQLCLSHSAQTQHRKVFYLLPLGHHLFQVIDPALDFVVVHQAQEHKPQRAQRQASSALLLGLARATVPWRAPLSSNTGRQLPGLYTLYCAALHSTAECEVDASAVTP